MSVHALAPLPARAPRHRADLPAKTPLTPVTTLAQGLSLGQAGRRGALLAVSSGLLANVALPGAGIAPAAATTQAATTTTVSLPLVAAPHAAAPVFEAAPLAAAAAPAARTTVTTAARSAAITTTAKATTVKTATVKTAAVKTAATKTAATKTAARPGAATQAVRGSAVLGLAARYVGVAYRYGGTTPSGFDCSGYTQYVYRHLGVTLPRTAEQQRRATTRISRSQALPGDLVFFLRGGRAYHVAIYAGDGMMYDAPRTGKTITKRKIWSSQVVFGRVTG